VLDLTERGIVLFVYVIGAVALAYAVVAKPELGTVLVLAANCAVVVFVVFRRRPERISVRASDWLIAIVGTVAPLFNGPPDGPHLLPRFVGAGLTVLGLAASLLAKLALRRNFSIVPARTGIVVRGPYRLVRHPMYSAYFVTHVGVLLYGFTLRNLFCYLICWVCLWARMSREEAVLVDAETYRDYCTRVPYRILWGVV
jgi:protein-S-isoprenylcysteine O-methyltransferase Ste14